MPAFARILLLSRSSGPASHPFAVTAVLANLTGRDLSLTIAGEAGDILVFDADLPHGQPATPRCAATVAATELHARAQPGDHGRLSAVRNVRMDTSEVLVP